MSSFAGWHGSIVSNESQLSKAGRKAQGCDTHIKSTIVAHADVVHVTKTLCMKTFVLVNGVLVLLAEFIAQTRG